MDSPVALALMAKAQAIFGNDDNFLSFPLVPLPFTKERLSFIAGGTVSGNSLNGFAEFTRMVNLIPGELVWLPTGGPYLWDIYNDVLTSAQLAQSNRTPDEEAAYQAAFKYLHIVHDDGTWEDTSQVKAYNQYRDASLALQQDYNSRKVAADLSNDPAVKQHWQDIDEPALQAQMQQLLNDWVNNGYKQQVEDARSTFARLGAKSPGQIWDQWQSQYNPHIDTLTDSSGQAVFITGFSPSDAIDAPTWQSFTLTGNEVTQLIASAPQQLKDRLDPSAIDLDIDTLSFEYTTVSLNRPWLQSDLFAARFWRLSPDATPLSDGQNPPHGRCPAYVIAVVFARNVEMRLKAQSLANTTALQRLQAQKTLSLGTFAIAVSPEMTETLKQPVLLSRPESASEPIPPDAITPTRPIAPIRPIETVRPAEVAATRSLEAALFETTRPIEAIHPVEAESLRPVEAAPISSTIPPTLPGSRSGDMQTEIRRPIIIDDGEISQKLLAQSNKASMALRGIDYLHLPPIHWGPPPPPPPPAVVQDDSIYIMTFICKPLPLCPNPDTALKW